MVYSAVPPLPERGEPWGLSNSFRCPGLNLSVDVSQGPESRKSFTVLDLNGVLMIRGSLTGFGGVVVVITYVLCYSLGHS